MGIPRHVGRMLGAALGALIIGLVLFAVLATTARAAATLVFDAELSLSGDCKPSKVDSVPDPGCPEGAHPPSPFSNAMSVATDSYGNIYVGSYGQMEDGSEGRIDVFSSKGFFLDELKVPTGVKSLAVDSDGSLYLTNSAKELHRYDPVVYKPEVPEIDYGSGSFEVVGEKSFAVFVGIVVNPLNDHVFAHYGSSITEYGSAAEENKILDSSIGSGTLFHNHGMGLAIDATRGRIYASDLKHSEEFPDPTVIRIFELAAPHKAIASIDGSTTPEGRFLGFQLSVAADEASGHVFVYDGQGKNVVYEFDENGAYIGTLEHESQHVPGTEITVDNGAQSPNGALNSRGRYLFLPSHPTGTGHSLAFGPPGECPAQIKSVSFDAVTENEAELRASVDPCFLATDYVFEFTTQEQYEIEGFTDAVVAGGGQIPPGDSPVDVTAVAQGLSADTAYRFRVRAANKLNPPGGDEDDSGFTTYPHESLPACPNDALRLGAAAFLPDCRAYEMVTPADTNARSPLGLPLQPGTYFTTRHTSPSGNEVSFFLEGGSLPGGGATGSLGGDPYLANRGEAGWSSAYVGPSGLEAPGILPGGVSPDQGYFFWTITGVEGSAGAADTTFVHSPDGHSALVGRGSIATDARASGRLIASGGNHILFVSGGNFPAVRLEEDAPPDGTQTIYDRTPDETTHVVSLLPGNVTPPTGQDAFYRGASLDGEGVAFAIGSKLYLRHDNQATYEIGENVTFAGVSEGGERLFYIEGGDLKAFDIDDGVLTFSASGDVTPVTISADGSAAFFVSTSILTGDANPNGQFPEDGEQNLYLSEEGLISFVGIVTERDVEGESVGSEQIGGLGLWTSAIGTALGAPGSLAIDPSRTTPGGDVLLFESRSNLTDYDASGHTQIYRYDSSNEELDCLSCVPTGGLASGEASLQSIKTEQFSPEPFSSYALVANLRADGRRAFFQSEEALVPGDVDGLQDIYEWEDQGVGSCVRTGGCVYLISSGHSERIDYLYAVDESGDNVFFRTSDLLSLVDSDETPTIYDARVGGGFPEPPQSTCQGEGCRHPLSPAPSFPQSISPPLGVSGNVSPKSCPKGKRRVKRHGKVLCAKKKQRKDRRHRAGSNGKRAGK